MPGQVRVVVEALKGFTERKIKEITLDATANLIEDTPRDTGWARANWVPSIGKAVKSVAGGPGRDAQGRFTTGTGNVGNAEAAQQQGVAEVATEYTLEKGKVFISNNVPYITILNNGSSRQAPKGFVQSAILRAVREAE